jgi:hypothetical protein
MPAMIVSFMDIIKIMRSIGLHFKLLSTERFTSGVMMLHYQTNKNKQK